MYVDLRVTVVLFSDFNKIEFSRLFWEKILYIKFNESSSCGNRAVPCRQKDGQTEKYAEACSRISEFCERA